MIHDAQTDWEKTVQWVGIVADCVIKQGDKYLLIQEKNPKAYGLWNIPAGYVDKGETIEAAAVREVKEESGYDVALDGPIGVWHESSTKPVRHAFRAHITGGELHTQPDEILDAKWLTYAEISQLNDAGKIRNSWIWEAITRAENEVA